MYLLTTDWHLSETEADAIAGRCLTRSWAAKAKHKISHIFASATPLIARTALVPPLSTGWSSN